MLRRVPGHWELILLALVLLLLFGAKQLPQIGRNLGRGVRELKDTVGEVDPRADVRKALEAPEDEARSGSTAPRDDSSSRSARSFSVSSSISVRRSSSSRMVMCWR